MRLGIDLGGTKIEIIALDESSNTLHRQRAATPQNNYQAILESITALVDSTEDQLQLMGTVGICTPGPISPHGSPTSGLLRNSNSVCLNGKPFKQDLERYLNRKIAIANDANCFALSEALDGAAKGANVVFGVIVGTGTGAGIVINRQVLTGANAIAGEWGHNPLPWTHDDERPGLPCYCGKSGCIETWLSGTGLARNFELQHQRALSAEQIVEGAEQGDEACVQAMNVYEDQMARGLAMSSIFSTRISSYWVEACQMSEVCIKTCHNCGNDMHFSDHVRTRLLPPVHGDSSGVRGAAWLLDARADSY